MTGIQQFVMTFEPGVELQEDAQWQAPAYCFPDDDGDEEVKGDDDATTSTSVEAATRLLRKLAGAAPTS